MMAAIERLIGSLARIDRIELVENLPLAHYTTFRIGGPAALAVFPHATEAAETALGIIAKAEVPYTVIGNGSNLLCADAGFAGVVLFTGKMKGITFHGNRVMAEAGASLTSLSLEAQRRGLDGLAFAYGIPGSVGGAVRMNAGAYGGQVSDVLCTSTFFDLADCRIGTLTDNEHEFDYRHSAYTERPSAVILRTEMILAEGDSEKILGRMQDFMQRRREKQPLDFPSAGSVFKRPEGYYAGKLIEDCGLKGRAIGGAQVSEKHAGFIINRGNATASDVLRLIDVIRETVLREYGVLLECELCCLG